MRNLITDVAGLRVGNASDARLKSGVTTALCDEPAVAGVQIWRRARHARNRICSSPMQSVEAAHAVVLSGGSAFGLDAASGVQAAARRGIGVEVGGFSRADRAGGDLFDCARRRQGLGPLSALSGLGTRPAPAGLDFALGTAGAGSGAMTRPKGRARARRAPTRSGHGVSALIVVNPSARQRSAMAREFLGGAFRDRR